MNLFGTLVQPTSPTECRITSNGAVQVDPSGRIAAVGSERKPAGDHLGGPDRWILPGFIDAHLHVPQWDRRGIDGLSLEAWQKEVVYPAEARFADAAFAEKLAEEFVTGMFANGTTTVAAYGGPFAEATDRVFSVFARRGLRAIFGQILSDMHCPSPQTCSADKLLDEARKVAAQWHNAEAGRLNYAFSPRSPACCSERLLRGAAELAKMIGCHIQTHVGECREEAAAVREEYPDVVDEIELFAELGLLTPKTLLGHGVVLHEDERQQLAETRTTLVHCPTANLFVEAGLMDYVAHRRAGVRMALGSSVASGPEPFMPQVAVACLQTAKAVKVHALPRRMHKVPTPAEAWWMLTAGAADALSLGDSVGRIEAGFAADLLVVRPEPWIATLPAAQQASALLYTLRPHQIEHVLVAGKRVGP
jgi:guanine deaminase